MAMYRRFAWAALVAAGVLTGFMLSAYQKTAAEPPAPAVANADEPEARAVVELKEIKCQLKEINTLLHTGMVKVVVILNPDKPDK
jgi:hypothetical protein